MQRDLTKRYSTIFKKSWIRNPFSLAYDIYKYGKLREFSSFLVWEVMHKLHLFPRSRYLVFKGEEPIRLDKDNLQSASFDERVTGFFHRKGLQAQRSEHPWKMLFTGPDGGLIGCLAPNDTDLYRSTDHGKSIVFLQRFPESIKSLFISSKGSIFVNAKGSVYRSADGGANFEKAFDLGSSESFLRFNNAMTETPDGTLLCGEYGNVWEKSGWKKLAYMYFSTDDGGTWQTDDFLIRMGANKHVHVVKYSPLLGRVVVADGDNFKRIWLSGRMEGFDIRKPDWQLINRFHIQMGGYTAVVEADGKVFFGTDYQGGTNFMVESRDGRSYTKRVVPDPYRRSPIDNMLVRKSRRGDEIWANLPFSAGSSKCLLMVSADGGATWNRVFEYSRSAHTVWLISASSQPSNEIYVMAADQKNNTRSVYRISDPL